MGRTEKGIKSRPGSFLTYVELFHLRGLCWLWGLKQQITGWGSPSVKAKSSQVLLFSEAKIKKRLYAGAVGQTGAQGAGGARVWSPLPPGPSNGSVER